MDKKRLSEINKIICASEIGQYSYCSISWYLQKCGYKPISPSIESGKENHFNMGKRINKIQNKINISKILAVVGFLFLFVSIIIAIFKVIL